MNTIAVLIPCYNEEATIGKVVRDFKAVLPTATVYVYDNNSSDNTINVALAEGAQVKSVMAQGKGNVMRAMFRDIEADCYLVIDGDDTYPAEHASELIEPILNGTAEMVIGDRLSSTYFQENKRPFHNIGNRMVRDIINHVFRSNVQDIMTGYRAFSHAFVKTFSIQSDGFEIETEMTIHALDKNLAIETVIVNYRDRPMGSESKLNTYRDGYRVLKMIGQLVKNYRPYRFFTTLATLFTVIGIGLFLPVWLEYLKTGLVPKIPTLMGSGFILVLAVVIFITGVILDVQCFHYRQQFETDFKAMKLLKGKENGKFNQ